jgi:NtrC-family two-component system sensor histidine kinase KinB
MKHWFVRLFGGFKGILFVLAVGAGLSLHLYTQNVVSQLRDESRALVLFYARMYAHVAETESSEDLSFIFDQIISRTNFPLIQTDTLKNPIGWKGISIPPSDTSKAGLNAVRRIIDRLDRGIKPIPVMYSKRTLAYLYYGDSHLIQQLQWLPYVEIGFVALFILIGFFGYANIKRSEQKSIWVGMAKETAHQLGTPISSLMGWIEIMKSGKRTKPGEIYEEMERDLHRLRQVTQRFSQIGSKPDLKKSKIDEPLRQTVEYIGRRAPQVARRVAIDEFYGETTPVPMNPDLFQWAVENLMKNALDAMDKPEGKIQIRSGTAKKIIFVEIEDNGRGIDKGDWKRIFKPGFSTKKRGWGLGLTLAKRIAEDYHGGRLFVKESAPGKGTVMRMEL